MHMKMLLTVQFQVLKVLHMISDTYNSYLICSVWVRFWRVFCFC